MNQLHRLRCQIDSIDNQLVDLFNLRQQISLDIKDYKYFHHLGITDTRRESQILDLVTQSSSKVVPDAKLKQIYQQLLTISKEVMNTPPCYYLGPPGSYSHQAASILSPDHPLIPKSTIYEVSAVTSNNKHAHCVLPIKNSQVGPIQETRAALKSYPLTISLTQDLPIHLTLAAKHPLMFKNIHQVFSKSQVFRQSAHWLHNHLPHAKLISVDSTTAGIERLYPWYSGLKAKGEFLPSMLRDFLTSEVAKATLRGKNRETCPSKLTRGRANLSPMGITASRRQAVICSPSAVKLYKLTPLAQNIEDNTNITTFGIIKATQ